MGAGDQAIYFIIIIVSNKHKLFYLWHLTTIKQVINLSDGEGVFSGDRTWPGGIISLSTADNYTGSSLQLYNYFMQGIKEANGMGSHNFGIYTQ